MSVCPSPLGPLMTNIHDTVFWGNSIKIGPSNYNRLEPTNKNRLHSRNYLAFPETRSADSLITKRRHTRAIRVAVIRAASHTWCLTFIAPRLILITSYGAIQMPVIVWRIRRAVTSRSYAVPLFLVNYARCVMQSCIVCTARNETLVRGRHETLLAGGIREQQSVPYEMFVTPPPRVIILRHTVWPRDKVPGCGPYVPWRHIFAACK